MPSPARLVAEEAPLTKRIVKAIAKLSARQKYDLLKLIEQNPDDLHDFVKMAMGENVKCSAE